MEEKGTGKEEQENSEDGYSDDHDNEEEEEVVEAQEDTPSSESEVSDSGQREKETERLNKQKVKEQNCENNYWDIDNDEDENISSADHSNENSGEEMKAREKILRSEYQMLDSDSDEKEKEEKENSEDDDSDNTKNEQEGMEARVRTASSESEVSDSGGEEEEKEKVSGGKRRVRKWDVQKHNHGGRERPEKKQAGRSAFSFTTKVNMLFTGECVESGPFRIEKVVGQRELNGSMGLSKEQVDKHFPKVRDYFNAHPTHRVGWEVCCKTLCDTFELTLIASNRKTWIHTDKDIPFRCGEVQVQTLGRVFRRLGLKLGDTIVLERDDEGQLCIDGHAGASAEQLSTLTRNHKGLQASKG